MALTAVQEQIKQTLDEEKFFFHFISQHCQEIDSYWYNNASIKAYRLLGDLMEASSALLEEITQYKNEEER